jgi:exopolysaccharide biosynthesis polyprenyl glycosylphosphotransferase
VGLGGALTFVAGVYLGRGYDTLPVGAGTGEYRSICYGLAATLVTVMGIEFFGIAILPPWPALAASFGAFLGAILLRRAQRSLVGLLRARGSLLSDVLIVASVLHAERVIDSLTPAALGANVVGVCVPSDESRPAMIGTAPVWGDATDAAQLAAQAGVDAVLVSAGALPPSTFRRLQWELERTRTKLVVVPEMEEILSNRLDVHVVGATPLMSVRLRPSVAQRAIKQAMDRVLGGLLLAVFSPIVLLGMALVRLTSPGPAIFRQVRIGRDGRPFTMLKLRTMCADAESRKGSLTSDKADAGPLFKLAADPRVTPIGRVLRRFSIDELPQLWNVVRGDMSLVGPRPPLPGEVATYDSMAVHRLHVKPGLTGLWQVSGRSDLSWEESVKLDLRYVDNWSIGFDLLILWRTLKAVLGAHGAY